MDIQVATLCDSAIDNQSKLYVFGAFDAVGGRSLPIVHPMCALALRVCFRPEDEGKREMSIRLTNQDGQELIKTPALPVEVALPENMDFVSRNFILQFQPLPLPQPGIYQFEVSFDGKVKANIPLAAILVEQGEGQAQA
jgi:hypothetical protein